MNRRGNDFFTGEAMYLILFVLAAVLVFGVIYIHTNNASAWQDYYSKELARVIDSGQPGDEISFDVQKGTEIAKDNGIDWQTGNLFRFDSSKHEVCVSLSRGGQSCYSYFKDLVIVSSEQPIEFGVPTNVLHFKIVAPSEEVK